MPVNLALPYQKFVDRDIIALAGLAEAKKPAAHRGHDHRLSPCNPALYIRRGKICNCQRTSVRPQDVTQTGRRYLGHSTLTRGQDHERTVIPGCLTEVKPWITLIFAIEGIPLPKNLGPSFLRGHASARPQLSNPRIAHRAATPKTNRATGGPKSTTGTTRKSRAVHAPPIISIA
jgi:hypothetical protein